MLRTTDEAFMRLKQERDELSTKLVKLGEFIIKARLNLIRDITLDDIHLLEEQEKHMTQYLYVLNVRIARVEGVNK